MRALPLFLIFLTACTAPTFRNLNAPSRDVTAQGLDFRVYYTLAEAEAYRLTPMLKPRYSIVQPAAIEAMEQASGCKVDRSRLQGDPAKFVADLIC